MDIALNRTVADQLRQIADLLEEQGANPFRVQAYRKAAATVASMSEPIQNIVENQGIEGLIALPTIGSGIARSIYEIVATGRASRLDNLRGELDPERLLQTVPGIGPALAADIHHQLQIDTLEALEMAAHDGRLTQLPGIGQRRASAIRGALNELLGQRRISRYSSTNADDHLPSVELLLEVDQLYREQASKDLLPKITPKRFNPEGKAWLPVLHCDRQHWHFTVLYSNTARAHDLAKTNDWVVIYFYDDHHQEGQCTVVTETRGPHQGERVVRGREIP